MQEKKPIALIHVREKKPIALIHVREKKLIALIHVREKGIYWLLVMRSVLQDEGGVSLGERSGTPHGISREVKQTS